MAAVLRAQISKSTCLKESESEAPDANEEIELDDGSPRYRTDEDLEQDLVFK